MFTHHELMLMQEAERRLALAAGARRGGSRTARRTANRAGRWSRLVRRPAPARASRPERRAADRPAGTLAAWGTSAESAP